MDAKLLRGFINAEQVVDYAKSLGEELSLEDAEAIFKSLQNSQISDDELDNISGGFVAFRGILRDQLGDDNVFPTGPVGRP